VPGGGRRPEPRGITVEPVAAAAAASPVCHSGLHWFTARSRASATVWLQSRSAAQPELVPVPGGTVTGRVASGRWLCGGAGRGADGPVPGA
jgi:hypothetical protein